MTNNAEFIPDNLAAPAAGAPFSLRWFGELAAAAFILGAVFWGPWLHFAMTGKPMPFGG